MSLLSVLLGRNIWNAPVLNMIEQENNHQLNMLHEALTEKLGYDVNDEVIKTLALKRMLECYNTSEIVNILKHFKQLKNGDNK